MRPFDVSPGVAAALGDFAPPAELGFGPVVAPVMYAVDWEDGVWGRGRLVPYGPIELWPGSRALQYAELVFEGLKAYRVGRARPNLFRPLENWKRLTRSARRLSMPPPPEALFMEAIEAVADAMTPLTPGKSGQALYLRPFLYGTESGYLIRNSATFRFMVIANLVEPYSAGPMSVAIERDDVRAAPGGLGDVKAAANYAGSLRASSAAVAKGHTVALWLDARERRFIQELSGMNLFAVIDGALHTPALDGAILPGVTRDSLITLARHRGYEVRERPMLIDELLDQIAGGACGEVFATGTAAIVSPISVLADRDGVEHRPTRMDHVAAELREALLAIQERRAEDPFGWVREVPAVCGPTAARR